MMDHNKIPLLFLKNIAKLHSEIVFQIQRPLKYINVHDSLISFNLSL